MERGRQRTPAGHVRLAGHPIESDAPHARLDVDVLRPAAGQTVVQPVGDAVHLPLRASGRRLRDQAVPTLVAGAMHVEKSDPVALGEWSSVDVEQVASNAVRSGT